MAGINIAFASDVRAFLKGTSDIEQSLEEVADSLDDLARESQDVGKDIGDDLERAGKEGTDAAEKMERSFKEAFDTATREARKASRDVGDDTKRGFDRASEGAEEFKDEAASSAREGAASFTGEFDDVADYIQETLANAFVGFGPAGAAAGLAAAIGMGVLITQLQATAEEINGLTEDAATFAQEMGAASTEEKVELLRDRWREVATSLADVRSAWELWQPRATTNIEEFARAAKDGNLNIGEMFEAINDPDPERRLERMRAVLEEVNGASASGVQFLGQLGEALDNDDVERSVGNLVASREAIDYTRDALNDLITQEEAAAAVTESLARAEGLTVQAYEERERATEEATRVQEAYNAALESAADPVGVYQDILAEKEAAERTAAEATAAATETAADSWEDYVSGVSVSVDDLIAEWNRQAEEAAAFETNLATIAANGGQALADELRAKGPEVAAATAAVIAESGPDKQRAAIDAHAAATGTSIGTATASGITGSNVAVQEAMRQLIAGLPRDVPLRPIIDHGSVPEFERQVNNLAFARSLMFKPTMQTGVQVP